MKTEKMLWPLLLLLSLPLVAHGHVALLFPPARVYDLDFLDNARTKGPCGMPKGDKKTSFEAGSTFNVTWHLAYPHRGGFKLEILDHLDRPLRDLTPTDSNGQGYLTGDPTAVQYEVTLPKDLTCVDCSIRLVRQALEWGPGYMFHSCADVDIADKVRNDCSGHGRNQVGRCRCDRPYWGARCQYRDECVKDGDCGRHGQCVNTGATGGDPRKQCYCQLGWFGENCRKRSNKLKSKGQFQEGLYTRRDLSDKLSLFWRILKEDEEIEMVMKVKGTGFAAVGWRPKGITASCRKFPVIVDRSVNKARSIKINEGNLNAVFGKTDKTEPEKEPEPEAESDPEPETKPEPETEPIQKPEPEVTTESDKEPRVGRRVSKSVDVGISFVMSSVSSSTNRRRRDAKDGEEEPLLGSADATAEPEPENVPEPESEPESEPETKPESEPEPEAESEPEPEDAPQPKKAQKPRTWTPIGDLHPMDCTDIVVGMARGSTSRVFDYYTRDRSTPRVDSYWDGEDDLTAAMGWEEDGETVIIFRKKLVANHVTDHEIVNDEMEVIWAVGQEPGMYSHSPQSGLETETPSVPDFYKPDEFKYHGKTNRGTARINFFDEIKQNDQATLGYCGGEWKHPRGCSGEERTCQYLARWEYNENSDKINFTVQTNDPSKWTGIGFSTTTSMSNTDVVIGWVDPGSGRYFIMDMWTTGYFNPILDEHQDLSHMAGKIADGIATLSFSRPRNTSHTMDVAFTDEEGMYMIFPTIGGKYDMVNKKIKKHDQNPIASTERIFIKSCRTADGRPTYTTPKPPPQLLYNAKFKIVDVGKNYRLPSKGTEDFSNLQTKISRLLKGTELKNVSGFQNVVVTNFVSTGQGEFNTQLRVLVNKDEFDGDDGTMTVEAALKNTVTQERLGNFKLDAQSLVFGETEEKNVGATESESVPRTRGNLSVKLWVVVACIAALVLVAVIQASCTIYKISTKGSSVQKEKLLPQSHHQWKDYSSGHPPPQTNYGYEERFADPDGDRKGWAQPNNGFNSYDRRAGGPRSQARPAQGGHYPGNGGGYGGYPAGYSSYDRRSGASFNRGGDFAPDHYFMPSQRKYSGEVLRVPK